MLRVMIVDDQGGMRQMLRKFWKAKAGSMWFARLPMAWKH
jgi:hypothetical protein